MQNRKKAPTGMYTAREAIHVLGMPSSTFYTLVRSGEVRGVILKGRKEAVYPKAEIDKYAREVRGDVERFRSKKYWEIALSEDIPQIRELVAGASGGYNHTVPGDVMQAWIRRNPQALHILRKGAEIVGYVSMFPLPLDTIMKRMSGEYWNRSIPIDDIHPYRPGGEPIRLYIAEVIAKQGVPDARRLGARLIHEILRFLYQLADDNIFVKEIYAVGTSSFGIQLCRELGMNPLDIPEGTREDRVPFVLDVATSTSPLVVSYREKVTQQQKQEVASG